MTFTVTFFFSRERIEELCEIKKKEQLRFDVYEDLSRGARPFPTNFQEARQQYLEPAKQKVIRAWVNDHKLLDLDVLNKMLEVDQNSGEQGTDDHPEGDNKQDQNTQQSQNEKG